MPITHLLSRLGRHLYRRSSDEARRRMLALADQYQPTQPSYAADLREAAIRQAPSSARAAPRNAGDWWLLITNTGMTAR